VESLAALRPEDIDVGNAEVHFRTAKGGRTYSVPLSDAGLEAARACLRLRPAGSPTVLGIKPRTVWLWVRQASEASGVPCHPHRLRHNRRPRAEALGRRRRSRSAGPGTRVARRDPEVLPGVGRRSPERR
jgi:integrase